MGTDELVQAILAWLAERYPHDRGDKAFIKLASGKTVPLDLPPALPASVKPASKAVRQVPSAESEQDVPDRWLDILELLEKGGPLKRDGIHNRLVQAGYTKANITTYRDVAAMVKRGLIKDTEDGFVPCYEGYDGE